MGPPSVNVGDTPEYNINVQNLPFWASKPIFQWDVSESTLGEINTLPLSNGGIGFGVPPTASQYHILVAATTYYNYFVYGYEVPLGIFPLDVPVNNPNPTPNPTPDPTPDIPQGKFNIAPLSYSLFAKVNYNNKADLAAAISSNYTTTSSDIRAGNITTLNDTFRAIKEKNKATLTSKNVSPSTISDWASGIQQKIYDLYTAKKLAKLGDFADFFDEVVKGLSYVK